MSARDWVDQMFPGEPIDIPDDDERQKADDLLVTWNERWHENQAPVPRAHMDRTPTNRAYLRSYLRRWWART